MERLLRENEANKKNKLEAEKRVEEEYEKARVYAEHGGGVKLNQASHRHWESHGVFCEKNRWLQTNINDQRANYTVGGEDTASMDQLTIRASWRWAYQPMSSPQ